MLVFGLKIVDENLHVKGTFVLVESMNVQSFLK